ncbi:triosephosphate isomerase [Candidatus Nitromaritima sp. SCGC AAA799-A02]|nr:triosephosphate isomerase [Candidatus Nitromaritima sp. SCGC AAA799-A02]
MRRPVVAGNWKMNMLISSAGEWVRDLLGRPPIPDAVEVIVAPPFTALAAVGTAIKGSPVELAGQNMGPEPQGARTGEISAAMLKDAGCRYVILGHSERRQYFAETDALINRKIKIACDHGLKVIFCVGETLDDREGERTRQVVEGQLVAGLSELGDSPIRDLVVAYEPVWAIGTGKNASPKQAQDVHRFIRDWYKTSFGADRAEAIRILYGGSVTPETCASLMAQADIDGLLVGGASLKSDSFYDIISSTNKA